MRSLTSDRGITLIEVLVMLTITVSILGALAPQLRAVTRRAEAATAQAVMATIATQINEALSDMNFNHFTVDGQGNGTKVEMLVSDGDVPRECTASGSACTAWQRLVNNTTGVVDFLERHIVTNNPRGSTSNAYRTTFPPGTSDIWRGPYLNGPIDPDPWGNRYMVNAQYLGFAGAGASNDVVVLSAGADEVIDTEFTANPLPAGGDDLIALVEP